MIDNVDGVEVKWITEKKDNPAVLIVYRGGFATVYGKVVLPEKVDIGLSLDCTKIIIRPGNAYCVTKRSRSSLIKCMNLCQSIYKATRNLPKTYTIMTRNDYFVCELMDKTKGGTA